MIWKIELKADYEKLKKGTHTEATSGNNLNEILFIIGNNDIVIMKEEFKNKCFFEPNVFDFGKEK